jgi:hypothetical protein
LKVIEDMTIESKEKSQYEPNTAIMKFSEAVYEADQSRPLEFGVRAGLTDDGRIATLQKEFTGDNLALFSFGVSCAQSLAFPYGQRPKTSVSLAYHIETLKKPDRSVIIGPALSVLSMLLQGIQPYEIKYRVLQKGKRVPIGQITDIGKYLNTYSDIQITRPEDQVITGEDDIFPFLDLFGISHEDAEIFLQKLEVATTGMIATYGGINMDVCYHTASSSLAIPLTKAEICPEKDDLLGLRMPKVWYFNPQKTAYSVAMNYNWTQARKYAHDPDINSGFRRDYGIVCFIECYSVTDLVGFAQANHLTAFSTPFDLVNTATFITRHLQRDGNCANLHSSDILTEFIDQIMKYISTQEGLSFDQLCGQLSSMDDNQRLTSILARLRGFWQDTLIPRGIRQEDEEIILVANNNRSCPDFDFNKHREPRVVFMSGNVDPHTNIHDDQKFVKNNLYLAVRQYAPGSKIIAPVFSDPTTGRFFRPHFLYVKAHGRTTDTAILQLIILRELGKSNEYWSLRSRYEELARRAAISEE